METVILEGNTLMLHKSVTKKTFKSCSLNRTKISDNRTRELIETLIEDKFNAIKGGQHFKEQQRDELIKAAINLNLIVLADKLISRT